MAKVRSWAGLDVHARSVLAVTMDAETGELRTARLPGETVKVVAFCAGLAGPTRVAYEAGPTGYGLARAHALHAVRVPTVEEKALRDLVRAREDVRGGPPSSLLAASPQRAKRLG